MKKSAFFIYASVMVALVISVSAYSQEDMVIINSDGFDSPRRPPAVFRHDEHNAAAEIEACNECHHVYENGEKVADESSEDQRCSECHTEKNSGNRPGLRKAFHLNCKGCHQIKKKGPVMCGECHVKKQL